MIVQNTGNASATSMTDIRSEFEVDQANDATGENDTRLKNTSVSLPTMKIVNTGSADEQRLAYSTLTLLHKKLI